MLARGAGTSWADGDEALRRLGQRSVDVLVSDQRMPQRDGWGLLAALRERSALPRQDDKTSTGRAGFLIFRHAAWLLQQKL